MKDNWITKLQTSLGLLAICSIFMGNLLVDAALNSCETSKVESVHLVDMDRLDSVTSAGLLASTSMVKGHQYSMHWKHGAFNGDVSLPKENTPRDWSQFTTLDLWIYSPEIFNNQFMVVIDCDQKETEGISYLSYKFNVNWKGWKFFSIPINELSITRNADPREVTGVRLVNTGWGMVINSQCELYFGEIKLSASSLVGSVGNLYDAEIRKTIFEGLGDGYAVYQGGKYAYSPENGLVPLDKASGATAVKIDGAIAMPRAFFEVYLGAKVTQIDGGYEIAVAGNTYTDAGIEQNGIIYFSVAEAAHALGFHAAEAEDVVLIGKSDAISDILNNVLLKEAVTYMAAYQVPNVNELTTADFKQVKDRWRLKLVGDETLDLNDARIAERVKAIENAGNSAWKSMNKSVDLDELWGKKINSTAEMTAEYSKIAAMAKAWATYGSSLYHDKSLRDDILFALQWMYENRYGEAEKTNSGWRSTNLFNWWDWQIGSPTQLIDTLMLMEEELDRETITKYLSLFDKLVPRASDYGSNMLDFSGEIIGSGLLQENMDRVIVGRDGADPTMVYADGGRNDKQGFYTDGSYVFHTAHPMNGTYGFAQFEKFADLMYLLEGTKFAYCNPQKCNVYEWAINAYEPLIYKGDIFRFVLGRHPSNGSDVASGTVRVYLELLQLDSIPNDVASHLKSTIKYMVTEDTTKSYYQGLSFESIQLLDEIMTDSSIKPRENYILNKMYYNMDKMTHQRETWAAGISMSSSRIYNYESINSENMTGWYLSDGMTYLYSENDLTQYNDAYWRNVDPYRLPGTTVNTGERQATSVAQKNEYLSSQDFVGGASLGGEYGTAAMYLESYHGDGIGSAADDGYGGSNPPRDCSLEAQKAWFMFDDEVVALGANVHAQDVLPVLTVVENRKLSNTQNSGAEKVTADGRELSLSENDTSLEGTTWVQLEGTGGYYFPEEQNVKARKTNKSNSFFELWLDHGTDPQNAAYSYVLLPNKTAAETAAYAQNPNIEVLTNTPEIQAVREKRLGVTGYVFWRAGTYDGISVSAPMIVMVKNKGNVVEVSACDPTQKLTSGTVTIDRVLTAVSADESITVSGGEQTVITIDFTNACGKSFEAKLCSSGMPATRSVVKFDEVMIGNWKNMQAETYEGITAGKMAPGALNDEGKRGSKWYDSAYWFDEHEIDTDMSDYQIINFRMYSAKATNEKVNIIFEGKKDWLGDYLKATITIDWVGWKDIPIKFSDCVISNKGSEAQIFSIWFNFGDWGINGTGNANTEIAVAEIYLSNPWYSVKLEDGLVVYEFDSAEKCVAAKIPSDSATTNMHNISAKLVIDETTGDILLTPSRNLKVDTQEYQYLNLVMYSDKATTTGGTGVNICIHDSSKYARAVLPVDWTGWKVVSIPLSEFRDTEKMDWSNIRFVKINSGGWSVPTIEWNTELRFDLIWFSEEEPTMTLKETITQEGSAEMPTTDAAVSFRFSNPLREIAETKLSLVKQGGTVSESVSCAMEGSIMTLAAQEKLEYGTKYTLTIPAGTVTDVFGQCNEEAVVYSFTTLKQGLNATMPTLTDSEGNLLTSMPANKETIKASTRLINTLSEAKPAMLILAFYDENNRMLICKTMSKIIPAYGTDILELTAAATGVKAKAFVLDSLATLQPLNVFAQVPASERGDETI